MKKLFLTTLILTSIHLCAQPGFNITVPDHCFGEKTPEIKQILIDRYGSLLLSVRLKAQKEAEVIERVMQENKQLMNDLESETKEAALACQALAHRLHGESWFASDEWIPHVRTIKNASIKSLSQFLPIYLKNSSLLKSDLQKIRTIIADLKNPSEKIQNLSKACLENMKKNEGNLNDTSLHNQLAALQEGNELLVCLFWTVDGLLNDETYVKKQLVGNVPQQTQVLVTTIIPFLREVVADVTPIVEQALDSRLQQTQ